MNIGDFIRKQRTRQGLTQIDLGKLLNVAHTTISNYENSISLPDFSTYVRLSDIFHANYIPLNAIFQNKNVNCELYEKAYADFFSCTKDIPDYRLTAISVSPEWKCQNLNSEKSLVIVETEPHNIKNNAMVIAPVPDGEEHIYRIKYCGENTYLTPESGPSYLVPVKIEKDKVPLKRILAIIQYP